MKVLQMIAIFAFKTLFAVFFLYFGIMFKKGGKFGKKK